MTITSYSEPSYLQGTTTYRALEGKSFRFEIQELVPRVAAS